VNARMRIAAPGSPNDGKEVEVLAESNAYDAMTDSFRPEFAEVRVIESGKVGGIDRQFLVYLN
jgi:hypothetical protein